jgi:hypothetical protein
VIRATFPRSARDRTEQADKVTIVTGAPKGIGRMMMAARVALA